MSEAKTLSLLEKVVTALSATFDLGKAMLFDLVRRAYRYAKTYATVVTFSVLLSISEALASKQ